MFDLADDSLSATNSLPGTSVDDSISDQQQHSGLDSESCETSSFDKEAVGDLEQPVHKQPSLLRASSTTSTETLYPSSDVTSDQSFSSPSEHRNADVVYPQHPAVGPILLT